MPKVEVIAEIGSTHDGDYGKALALVHAAAVAGADAVKGQFWSDADRLADRRKVPSVYRDAYRRYGMPVLWIQGLKATADMLGLEWMCTTYLPEDIAVMAPYVKRFKVSSFEASDRSFLDAHEAFGKPVVVSWGMKDSLPPLSDGFSPLYLQCVSAYPAPLESMNLATLWPQVEPGDVAEHYRFFHGLSDHSRQIDMGAMAVAAGAEIIEAHIRLDDTDPQNPDFETAFSPAEFAEYVALIRRAETIMGDGVKRLQPAEQAMAAYRVRG